jgi:hypothetical protein
MANIRELLHWKLLNSVFKSNAEKLITHKTKEVFNTNITQLNNIAAKQSQMNQLPKQELIEEVYDKFKSLETVPIETLLEHFSKREVRLLVWSLDYKGKDSILFGTQFFKFVSLVNKYWRDSYIIPLWYILLKNWNTLSDHKTRFPEYTSMLKNKCDAYDKSRKDVLAIKLHFNFWEKKVGIDAFVDFLISKNIQIPTVCQSLNLNANLIGTDYYFESFLLYLKRIKNEDIYNDLVIAVLLEIRKIKNSKYQLLYLSTLITYSKFYSEISVIQRTAIEVIGDPITKRHWLNNHLNAAEEELVEAARKKLLVLMNKDFIEIFFSKLVQDPRREVYWLKFIDHIEDIKFVGNRLNYSFLKRNEQISKFVDARYSITRSNQSTSALIMWAKDYVFVEFSDTGAIYIYKTATFNSKIKLKYIERIEDLKTWPVGSSVIKSSGSNFWAFKPEGTHAHIADSWEFRLNIWMKKYFYN